MDHMMNTYSRFDVTFSKGKGNWLYDNKGKAYLDFVAGVAVNCLGHCNDEMVKAIEEQSKKLIHVSNLYWNEEQIKLAEKLVKYSDHKNVFFCNSGTESVEVAIKIARKYGAAKNPDKNVILYAENSFHGRTMGALSITGQTKYQTPFMPLMKGTNQFEFNNLADFEAKINENTCAVILEPIQGEGGVVNGQVAFIEAVKALCEQHDALLIFDEVQCGIGRTGKFFAYETLGIVPDVLCIAKGLGGGFPIGATLAGEKAYDVLSPGDHGCTFGGSPLACATANVVVDQLNKEGFLDNVQSLSAYFIEKLLGLKDQYEFVKDISGKGLMLGVDVGSYSKEIVSKAFEKGLLLVGAGKTVVRIVPALNINKKEIDLGIKILDEVLSEIQAKQYDVSA